MTLLKRQAERCVCGKVAVTDFVDGGFVTYCSGFPVCATSTATHSSKRLARAAWNKLIRGERQATV